MKKVISSEKIPIKLWLDDIEEGALDQAKNLANLPFVFKHIAIMPDSHQGFGMPIGGVMATENVVVPNAVGVDIGCGMCAVKTSLTEIDTDTLKKIMGEIRKVVPLGFNRHKEKQDDKLMPQVENSTYYSEENLKIELPICGQQYESALKQLGTLGGGNHFIEIQEDNEGFIWIMIHSGSRNLGFQVANHYNKLAIELNQKWHSQVPKNWELAFLPTDSLEGRLYLMEMNYCVDYALANRELMMNRIKHIIGQVLNLKAIGFEPIINIAHNYAKMENRFGNNVVVHRKGATLATKDTIGIIPSSQGTKSYIVKGKGELNSFNSCSHGAGRVMSRTEAIKTLNFDEELKRLDDKGIIHDLRSRNNLDEASSSYKDIDLVMKNQEDLVEILVELNPLAVVKG